MGDSGMSMTGRDVKIAASEAEQAIKIIKRYTNRKLYDTVESRYVTLEEIAEMVKGGTELQILDNRTKDDLTSVTLAQIIFEEEKRQAQMPLGVLRRIIQGGSAVSGFISEKVTPKVDQLRGEAEHRMGRLFKREDHGEKAWNSPNVRDLFSSRHRALEDWQRRVDERVRSAVEAVTGVQPMQREMQRLHERLDALEKKLEALEAEGEAL